MRWFSATFALALLVGAPAAAEGPGEQEATLTAEPAAEQEVARRPEEPEEPAPRKPVISVWADRPATLPGYPRIREPEWVGEPISLSVKDADIREVLRSFARIAGINIVISPEVRGTVTVELHDVPWDQALHVILKTHGLGAEIDGRYWLP